MARGFVADFAFGPRPVLSWTVAPAHVMGSRGVWSSGRGGLVIWPGLVIGLVYCRPSGLRGVPETVLYGLEGAWMRDNPWTTPSTYE